MATNKFLVQDDTAAMFRATLTRHDTGEAIDITNDTVVLKIRKKGTTTVLFTITGYGTAEELAAGIVVFDFSTNLGIDPGWYEGEIEITYQSTKVESVYELVYFHVREDF